MHRLDVDQEAAIAWLMNAWRRERVTVADDGGAVLSGEDVWQKIRYPQHRHVWVLTSQWSSTELAAAIADDAPNLLARAQSHLNTPDLRPALHPKPGPKTGTKSGLTQQPAPKKPAGGRRRHCKWAEAIGCTVQWLDQEGERPLHDIEAYIGGQMTSLSGKEWSESTVRLRASEALMNYRELCRSGRRL
jgi:hypothetical protein